MARTIEFDYDAALAKALRLFWKGGYAGTPMRALLKGMGIGEGSFYNTIKSKKALYLQCLRLYNATEGKKRAGALMAAPDARLGMRALFSSVLDCLDDPQSPSRLCMMAGSLSEDVLAEPELREFIAGEMATFAKHLTAHLAADRDAGRLAADFDPDLTVPVIITYLQGIWRMALVSYDRATFERQMNLFLTGLGL